MRNLKRVLALAMAMIMMLSMMVIGTSAASVKSTVPVSDEYAEAVEILSNMGVFKGQANNAEVDFAPKAILTRAEAAALIYRVITGDVTDAQKDNYDYASMKDIKAGQWYTGYVTYANNGGYIKGDENGNFNPNAQVTGIQVIAIMLRAAGYGQNGEYEGKAWKDNILTDAKDLGVIGDISTATLDAPASRELVAQLLFNAISGVKMVTYTPMLGYIPVKLTALENGVQTLGLKVFGLKKVTGVLTANEKVDLFNAGKRLPAGVSEVGGVKYNLTTDETLLGEKITFWTIGTKTAVSTPKSLAEVKTFDNTAAAVLSAADKKALNDAGVTFYNYVKQADTASAVAYAGKGVAIKAVNNDDKAGYEYVLVVEETMDIVKRIDSAGTVSLINTKSASVQDKYEGIAAGDVVLVNTYGGVTHMTKADYVTGIVDGYDTTKNTTTIAGADYSVSTIDFNATKSVFKFNSVKDTYELGADWNGTTYNYYQDAFGNIRAYAKASELATGYALILDYDVYKSGAFQGDLTWRPTDGINFGDLYIKYLTTEGEVQTAKVDANLAKYLSAENITITEKGLEAKVGYQLLPGDVVDYRINEDGEFVLAYTYEYETGLVTINSALDLAVVNTGSATGTYAVDDDLVVFYYTNLALEIENLLKYGDFQLNQLTSVLEILSAFGPFTPAYGVLTGDAAVADLDSTNYLSAEILHQMDGRANGDYHLGQTGVVKMMNIRGNIDTFVDHCYVLTTTGEISKKIDGVRYWVYKAINSKGEPIEIYTNVPQTVSAENPIYVYRTINLNGTTINWMDSFVDVKKGDLHATRSDSVFMFYSPDSWDGEMIIAPEVYADASSAKGGTVKLDTLDCSTGYVVIDSAAKADGGALVAEAVFVVEDYETAGQNLFIDTTINEEYQMHLRVGDTLKLPADCYDVTVKDEDNKTVCDKVDVHAKDAEDGFVYVTITRDWEDNYVTIAVDEDCDCTAHTHVKAGAIVKIWDADKAIVTTQNDTAYMSIKEAAVESLNKGEAEKLSVVFPAGKTWEIDYAIYTSTAAAEKGSAADYKDLPDTLAAADLKTGNILVLKITTTNPNGISLDKNVAADCDACHADVLYVVYEIKA